MSNRPAAYRHTLLMEGGQKSVRLTMNKKNPFGKRGEDYSREYEVVTVPMYTRAPSATSAGVDEVARDAERYRCLRSANADDDVPYVAIQKTNSWGKTSSCWLQEDEADQAIDAAIQSAARGDES